MVDFMERHRDLATNKLASTQYKDKSNSLWNELATQLNAEGPPVRNSDGWKKVWKDIKYYTSTKLTYNINGKNKTGGGKFKEKIITPLEERIIGICKLKTRARGINSGTSFGIQMEVPIVSPSEVQNDTVTTIPNFDENIDGFLDAITIEENINTFNSAMETASITSHEIDNAQTVLSQRNRKNKKENTPNRLLIQQVENQSKFNESFKIFNTEKLRILKEVRNELKSLRKLKEKEITENLRFKRREEERIEELHKLKIEIKQLELKKLQEFN